MSVKYLICRVSVVLVTTETEFIRLFDEKTFHILGDFVGGSVRLGSVSCSPTPRRDRDPSSRSSLTSVI